MIIQDKLLLKRIIDGKEEYTSLDLNRSNPYILFAACMPWGKPFGLYADASSAQAACDKANTSKEMEVYRKQNKRYGLEEVKDCFITELPMPSLLSLFSVYGEIVKLPQKDLLLLSEQGGNTI
jgi:hypothetical protein